MGNRKPRINPFYVVLVLTGIAFALTACAMGVMMVRDARASHEIIPPTVSAGEQQFADIVNRYAVKAMMIELGILAVSTMGAIGTDRYWAGE